MSRYRQILNHIGKQKAKIIRDFQGDKSQLAELILQQQSETNQVKPTIITQPRNNLQFITSTKERAAFVLYKCKEFKMVEIESLLGMADETIKKIVEKYECQLNTTGTSQKPCPPH